MLFLTWFEQLLIWLVIICAVFALLKLLVSFVIPKLGLGGEVLGFVVKAVTIVIWAFVCICLIYFIFTLIGCLGPGLPRLR